MANKTLAYRTPDNDPCEHILAYNPLHRVQSALCYTLVAPLNVSANMCFGQPVRTLQNERSALISICEQVLYGKAKQEAEEAQRILCGALNGLAALHLIDKDPAAAIKAYRQVPLRVSLCLSLSLSLSVLLLHGSD